MCPVQNGKENMEYEIFVIYFEKCYRYSKNDWLSLSEEVVKDINPPCCLSHSEITEKVLSHLLTMFLDVFTFGDK